MNHRRFVTYWNRTQRRRADDAAAVPTTYGIPTADYKLLWLPSDGLTPNIGGDLTLARNAPMYDRQSDNTFDRVAANALPSDHFVNGQYVSAPGYQTEFTNWDQIWAVTSLAISDSGTASAVTDKNWKLIQTGAYVGATFAIVREWGNAISVPDDGYATAKIVVKKYSTTDYCMIGLGNAASRFLYGVKLKFSTGTVVATETASGCTGVSSSVEQLATDTYLVTVRAQNTSGGAVDYGLTMGLSDPGAAEASFDYSFSIDGSPGVGFYASFAQLYSGLVDLPLASPATEGSNLTVPDSNLSRAIATTSGRHLTLACTARIKHAIGSARESYAQLARWQDLDGASSKYREIRFDKSNARVSAYDGSSELTISTAALVNAIAAGATVTYMYTGTRLYCYDHTNSLAYTTGDDTGNALSDGDIDNFSIGSKNDNTSFSEHLDGNAYAAAAICSSSPITSDQCASYAAGIGDLL